MTNTKRLENIPGLPEGAWCVIKKFSYGESCKIKSKAIKVKMSKNHPNGDIDFNIFDLQLAMLEYGVKEASFLDDSWTREQRRAYFDEKLEADAGEFIFDQINSYNTPNEQLVKK